MQQKSFHEQCTSKNPKTSNNAGAIPVPVKRSSRVAARRTEPPAMFRKSTKRTERTPTPEKISAPSTTAESNKRPTTKADATADTR